MNLYHQSLTIKLFSVAKTSNMKTFPLCSLLTRSCVRRGSSSLVSASRFFSTRNQKSIVVALGGNALKKPNEKGTYEEMLFNVESATSDIMKLAFDHNYKLAITHGNGPQIGSIYLQNQMSEDTIPAMPLSICGSMTQGYIGYMLQQSIQNHLNTNKNNNNNNTGSDDIKGAITCVTQVKVNINDKAWESPSKPVGKFYDSNELSKIETIFGKNNIMYDSGRGYRYAVASPKPIEIIEIEPIKLLFENGYIIIASGGGGIPVICTDNNSNKLEGRDAVIDKDLTAVLLAKELKCDTLMIATDIDAVYLNYLNNNNNNNDSDDSGKILKKEKLKNVKVNDMTKYYHDGHFGKGSMEPKILAAIEFVKDTGNDCIIGALNQIEQCVVGDAGTRITA